MDFKEASHKITFAVTVTGIFSFVASLIYDYFFILGLGLGLELNQILGLLSDISQAFLYWLPWSILMAAIWGATLWIYLPSFKAGISPARARMFTFLDYLICFFIVISMFSYILLGDIDQQVAVQGLFFLLVVVVAEMSRWLARYILKNAATHGLDFLKIYLPIFFTGLFFLCIGYKGWADSFDVRNNNPTTIIFLNSHKNIKTNIIRVFDNGVLVGEKETPIDFLPWSQIVDIRFIKPQEFKGILCDYFKKCAAYKTHKVSK